MAIDTTLLAALIAATPGGYITAAMLTELKENLEDLESGAGGTVDTDSTLTGDGSSGDPLSVAVPLPAPVDPDDDGKILTAGSGAATWEDAPSGLPDTSGADEDDVLMLDASLDPYWGAGTPGPQGEPGDAGPAGGFNSVQAINAQSTDYTLVLGDAGKLIKATDEATITVPLNSSVEFDVGQHIDIVAWTAEDVIIAGAIGVVLRAPYGTKLRVQYGCATLVKMAEDEWLLVGDLEALA